ncbi:Cytochrome p450, partial [Phytophthora palmivora]
TPNKCYTTLQTQQKKYVRFPELESRLIDWIAEMRREKSRCVTVKCIMLIIAKFDPAFALARRFGALRAWVTRVLKRNRLTVRQITHRAKNIDVVQGTAINGSRCTVFLCASATGEKLPLFNVFTCVPGGPVSKEVEAATFGDPSCAHTVQRKAWTDHDTMQKWINEPMDVSVMHSFKAAIERLYIEYHVNHPFPKTASDRRAMLSLIVAKAWAEITPATVISGFRKAHLIPIGPRNEQDVFSTFQLEAAENTIVSA